MKNIFISALTFLLFASAQAEAIKESDFYKETIHLVDATVNLVDDYGANGNDANDDTQALQNAIDAMTKNANGGKIMIPPGTFYIMDVTMKSNVHIVIDSTAILKASKNSGSMFLYGYDSKRSDAAITISNISIRSNSKNGAKYTVDYSHCPRNPNKINFVKCKNVSNFLIADFLIKDNQTKLSCITTTAISYNDDWWQPKNGVIKNGELVFGHFGYGVIQAQTGKKILFKDLKGEGGITLRLESGAVGSSPESVFTDSIYGRNLSVYDGQGAFMMQPHTKKNGHVDVDGVLAVSSTYAVYAGGGYTSAKEDSLGYTPGRFANSCVISNVHAVYGENAQLKSKHFNKVPCAIRHLISKEPIYDGKIYGGPSGSIVLSTCDEGSNPYTVTWKNITSEGFKHQFNMISLKAHTVSVCNDPPVSGLVLTDDTIKVEMGSTKRIASGIIPANAENPEVRWSSANKEVATINEQGLVTPVSTGLTTVFAVATDGGYTDSCLVKVVGLSSNLKEEKVNALSVYPNPAKNQVFINNPTPIAVKIFSSTGRLVKHIPKLNPNQAIGTGQFSPGLYILKIIENNNNQSVALNIKQCD